MNGMGGHGLDLLQDTWRAFANVVMDFQVPYNAGTLLTR